MIVLSLTLCLAASSGCSTFDFEPSSPFASREDCYRQAPMISAALLDKLGGSYSLKEIRCRDRSETDS